MYFVIEKCRDKVKEDWVYFLQVFYIQFVKTCFLFKYFNTVADNLRYLSWAVSIASCTHVYILCWSSVLRLIKVLRFSETVKYLKTLANLTSFACLFCYSVAVVKHFQVYLNVANVTILNTMTRPYVVALIYFDSKFYTVCCSSIHVVVILQFIRCYVC